MRLLLVQPLEGPDCHLVLGLQVAQLTVRRGRLVRPLEHVLQQEGQLLEHVDPHRVLGPAVGPGPQQLGQVVVALLGLEQRVERGERQGVVRLAVEDQPVVALRALPLAEGVVAQRGQAARQPQLRVVAELARIVDLLEPLDLPRAVLDHGGQTLEVAPQLLLAWILTDRLGDCQEGRFRVGQRFLVHPRQPPHQLQPLGAGRRALDDDLQGPGELGEVVRLQVVRLEEPRHIQAVLGLRQVLLERRDGLGVAGLGLEHLAERADRLELLVERPGEQLAEPEGQRQPGRAGLGPGALPLQHLGQLGGAVGRLVEIPLQGIEGRGVVGFDVQHLPPDFDRVVGAVEPLVEQPGELDQPGQPRRRIGGLVEPLAVERRQQLELARGLQQVLERLHGLHRAGVLAQQLAVGLDCRIDIAESRSLDAGDASQQVDPLLPLRLRQPLLEQPQQLLERPQLLGVQLERRDDIGVLRRDLEAPAGPLEGPRGLVEPVGVQLHQAPHQRQLVGGGRGEVRQHGQHAGQRLPVLLLLVDPRQRLGRRPVLRLDLQHPLVGPERALGLSDALLVDARRLERQLDPQRPIVRAVRGHAEALDQPLPVVLRLVQLLQGREVAGRQERLLEHPDRLGVSGLQGEHLLVRRGGPLGVAQALLVQAGQLAQQLDAVLLHRLALDALADHPRHFLEVLRPLRQPLDRVVDVQPFRVELEDSHHSLIASSRLSSRSPASCAICVSCSTRRSGGRPGS